MTNSTFCLSFHSSWRCQHAGACCRAGWAIPVERQAFEHVRVHFGNHPEVDSRFVTGGPLPEGAAAMLATRGDGACVFHDNSRCAIHRELGHEALPIACQQFPRIALHDPRGTFVTLSHFCPTAARLLVTGRCVEVVPAPASLVALQALEGLDALRALPPLLTPTVLTDLDGYAEWERQCLRILALESLSSECALDTIEAATRRMIGWRPEWGPLGTTVQHAFSSEPSDRVWTHTEDEQRFRLACAAVPRGLGRPSLPESSGHRQLPVWWPELAGAARRFVAAHLFGNWVAYHGRTLITLVTALKICLSVLRIEAIRSDDAHADQPVEMRFIEAVRRSDLLLVHLLDIPALVRTIEGREIVNR